MIVVRYADDTIVGFQQEHEARTFLDELKGRMRQFELALTRLFFAKSLDHKQERERLRGTQL